jgi:hypothetical protein
MSGYRKYPPENSGLTTGVLWLACVWLAIFLIGTTVYRLIF